MSTRIVNEDGIMCYYDRSKRHSYDVGTNDGTVCVDANNRSQAKKIAEKHGYTVRDVNMVA